jgi:PhzF family phenazine biosynthesis protein
LAVVHALRSDDRISSDVRFSVRSGTLTATVHDGGAITLDFPAAVPTEATAPDGLGRALGAEPEAVYTTGALRDLLTVFDSEDVVRDLAPDIGEVERLARRDGLRGVIATAPAAPQQDGYDFVSRFFAPTVGIAEDPVTGSAHTTLGPYWSARLGRPGLTGLQASARTGLVRTTVDGDRVHLTGGAVTMFDGTLLH